MSGNDESCQEEAERGSHGVPGPWIEVTIIPVDRLEAPVDRPSSSGEVSVERQDTGLWRKEQDVKRPDSPVWRKDTSGKDPILLCSGNVASACINVYRMSVWSRRHCLWEYTGCQL